MPQQIADFIPPTVDSMYSCGMIKGENKKTVTKRNLLLEHSDELVGTIVTSSSFLVL